MNGSLSLSEYPGELVRLACEKCGRVGQYRKAKLIERYGADVRLPVENPEQIVLALCGLALACAACGLTPI